MCLIQDHKTGEPQRRDYHLEATPLRPIDVNTPLLFNRQPPHLTAERSIIPKVTQLGDTRMGRRASACSSVPCFLSTVSTSNTRGDFPGCLVVKTPVGASNAKGVGSIPSQRAMIPHAAPSKPNQTTTTKNPKAQWNVPAGHLTLTPERRMQIVHETI